MEKKIWLSPPHMGGDEIKYVQDAFESNWVSTVGPHINMFEKELSEYTTSSFCAALSSGTAAIHLALITLGVGQRDEVICSSFTFCGSCNPVVYQGATPVFIDSETETWNMDPQLLEIAIQDRIKKNKKPKAIILVHLYGMPAKLDQLLKIAKQYAIPVIEDAAEALGSEYAGKKLGTFGDMGVFSFNGNKIITTSGGGALVSTNESWISKAKFLATQAREKAVHYEHAEIGYNYRLSNISAAIGLGQLNVLQKRVLQKREIYKIYRSHLKDLPGISFLEEPDGSFSNRWLTTILVDPAQSKDGTTKEDIRLLLETESIESRPLWKPMHLQPAYKNHPAYKSGISERLFENGLCLPSGSTLDKHDIDRICRLIAQKLA